MHATATPDEVRLRKGSSLSERLVWAGSGGAVLLIVVPGIVTWASGGPPLAAAFWAVPLGIFLIGVAALVDNPFDAANTEIVLRSPVSLDVGWLIRMAVPLLATLCSLPFLVAFGIGESELALGLLLPLGLIVAVSLYRYTHRLSGTRWIVRHGDIRIERISWSGRLFAEMIRSGDVAGIDVANSNTRGKTFTVIIRLHTGQPFPSPTRHAAN